MKARRPQDMPGELGQLVRAREGGPMIDCISFVAPGRPATKGSTRSFMSKAGLLVTKHDNPRTKAWQGVVACAAQQAGVTPAQEAVRVHAEFVFLRPKGHYGAKGIKSAAPSFPTSRSVGDLDKLVRALLDGLTGVAFADDSQVFSVHAFKRWAGPNEGERALVTIERTGG